MTDGRQRADQLDDRPDLFGDIAQVPVGQPQVHPPVGAQHHARRLGLALALGGRAVAAHLAAREVAESHAQAFGDMMRDGRAHADLDVVGMGAEGEEVDGGHGTDHTQCCVPGAACCVLACWVPVCRC